MKKLIHTCQLNKYKFCEACCYEAYLKDEKIEVLIERTVKKK